MIPQELLKKIRRIEITTNRLVNDVMAGQYLSAFKGRGMEFSEVREYVPGDDIRTIDWNVTARFNQPFIKRYVEERELIVLFLIDMSGSLSFGTQSRLKSELAAEICAILAFSAIKNNDQVGTILFTDQVESYIPPQKGAKHALRVIRDILYHSPKGKGTDIRSAFEFLGQVQKRRAVVFLVSDFLFSGYEQALRIANRRYDLVAISIEDPRELTVPDIRWLNLQDAETGETFCVNLSSASVRKAFATRVAELKSERDTFLASAGIDHLKLRTDQSYESRLIRFLRTRARRMR